MIGFLRKVGRSIFFKLVLVFIATAIVMAMAVGGIVRHVADDRSYRGLIGKNMAQYSMFLIDEIGNPPKYEIAQKLTDEFRVAIRITSPGMNWSSTPPPPRRIPAEFTHINGFPNVKGARDRGRIFIEVDQADANYSFVFGRIGNQNGPFDGGIVLLIVLVVGVVLTLSYLTVRWLFKPLEWLTGGMQNMGRGDLDTTIPIRKYDELGELAAAFNDMSRKIRDQIKAKQQLLLDVSHELRSPLTRTKLAAEFIPDDKIKLQITADLDEMEWMTNQILESERLASERGGLILEDIDLSKLVADLVAIYEGSTPGVEMTVSESVRALLDPERVRALLRNLIDNALKYSGAQERPVKVGLHAGPDRVLITVEDYGEGIPEEDLPLIFEPFYRVDKSRHRGTGGYGLGLSLCRKIMQAHGGSIDVESRTGEGTRFLLRFPMQR